jgi:hypothetical protein
MKIDDKFINDIFVLKIRLKNKNDKIKLSKYDEWLPMYNIYKQSIEPINKEDIYNKLIKEHYRFINNEVKRWIEQLYDKSLNRLKNSKNKQYDQLILSKFERMKKIIENYDIETLIKTSSDTLYKYTERFGLSISICKRNSFTPFISYLPPYYTQNELVKLGQNLNLIPSNFNLKDLLNEDTHYKICKNISNNDVSIDEILKHINYVIKENIISDIVYYSFIGSSLLNRYLRNQSELKINTFYYDRLINLGNKMKNAPALDNDYQLYRFIADDSFIKDLKIGDIFSDNAFLSTTRDPFYTPGVAGTFGLVLVKINIKKNIPGIGLFMEHFSIFPKEEEFILPPCTKLKLVSKDNNFKYFHTNKLFEDAITKKYEFDFVGLDYKWVNKIKISDESIPKMNNLDYSDYNSRNDMFIDFVKNNTNYFNQINISGKIFYCFFFDSTTAFKKIYYNNTKKGLSLIEYDDNGYINLMIELDEEMVVNYINQFYFYNKKSNSIDEKTLDILFEIAKLFKYNQVKIFNNYENFTKFESKYYENQKSFLYINLYNHDLYNYLKHKQRPFNNKFIIDFTEILDSKINDSTKQFLIHIIENNFMSYYKQIEFLDIEDYNYSIFDINAKLNANGEQTINYNEDNADIDNGNFKLIFRENDRRR